MKTRVVQLITFEVETGKGSASLAESELDQICKDAAQSLRFAFSPNNLHAGTGIFMGTSEGGLAMVTVAKVSSDDLQLILLDRRRLHAENVRLHAQREVLRAFIKESCSGPKSVEALDIAEAVNPEPNEDPEETQG